MRYLCACVAAAVIGWKLGGYAYRELGIHEIELFANRGE